MKFTKFMFAVVFFLTRFASLNADWDPEFLDLKDLAATEVLKKQELNDLKNRIFQYLENSWCSKEKANFLVELIALTSPKVCVEIGTFTGATALPILATLQFCGQGKLYAIDAWSCKEAILGLPSSDANTEWWGTLDMIAVKARFYDMLKSWSLNTFCRVMPIPSKNAAKRISSIDFLHLDGNFSEEGSLIDSQLYVPKVKSGGYIVLSNVHIIVGGKPSKMKALIVLLDQCEVVCEVDGGQTLLFRKN